MIAQIIVDGSIARYAIIVVAILAICALVLLYCQVAKVEIPPYIIQGLKIVAGAAIIIILILFIARVAGLG